MPPLTGFCCGCSLGVGVKVITLLHLSINVAVLFAIFNDIVRKTSTYSVLYGNHLAFAMLMCGWTLSGALFCVAGFWGTLLKSEAMVRIYWFYAVACYIIMTGVVFTDLVLSDPCENLHDLLHGAAAAATCGVFRTVNALCVGTSLSVPLYFLLVVRAYRDGAAHGGLPGLGDPAGGSDRLDRPWLHSTRGQGGAFDPVVGGRVKLHAPGGHGSPSRGDGYGAVYTQAAAAGLGGSRPLFGRPCHGLARQGPAGTA